MRHEGDGIHPPILQKLNALVLRGLWTTYYENAGTSQAEKTNLIEVWLLDNPENRKLAEAIKFLANKLDSQQEVHIMNRKRRTPGEPMFLIRMNTDLLVRLRQEMTELQDFPDESK